MKTSLLIGVDLGGTDIKAGLFQRDGRMLNNLTVPTAGDAGPDAVIGRIVKVVNKLRAQAEPGRELLGVGIGVPGNHDLATGTVVSWSNLKWYNVPIKAMLETQLALPVSIDNDANAAALGEHWQGAGRGTSHMIMVTIGTGIGGGLILNGSLYRGAGGSAGEIGHTILLPGGPECNCGVAGHLEALTAAPWIVARAQRALEQGRVSQLSRIEPLEAEHIFGAARQNDELALQVVAETADYLAMGLANLVNIFNPELIVVGGGVAKAGEQLLEPIRKGVSRLALKLPAKMVKVVAAALGNWAGSYGAAAIMLEQARDTLERAGGTI
ncbi:MAG TPA: ROK family glucokinase [Bacillota bacterium]|nr:ROK family glucokinase [Bacillota bacterium]